MTRYVEVHPGNREMILQSAEGRLAIRIIENNGRTIAISIPTGRMLAEVSAPAVTRGLIYWAAFATLSDWKVQTEEQLQDTFAMYLSGWVDR